jgi:non-heme chloroperoxidase
MRAGAMTLQLTTDPSGFFERFVADFYSRDADGDVLVSKADRQRAIAMCHEADRLAALEAMQSFGIADFRDDLRSITVPTLVLHGDADGIVPFEGSGARTHAAIPDSELVLIEGAPHGCNLTHAGAFNAALLRFLKA